MYVELDFEHKKGIIYPVLIDLSIFFLWKMKLQ